MLTTLQAATLEHFGSGKEKHAQARRIAGKMFDRAYGQGKRSRLWAILTGKAHDLPELPRQPKTDRRMMATVVVPLAKIVGTEGRSEDFDADFNPLKQHNRERWISVAAARRMGIVLPAVELLQVGDEYYVRDGHHRVSVAKVMGQLEIDARVVN
jgi:hypothetical protein